MTNPMIIQVWVSYRLLTMAWFCVVTYDFQAYAYLNTFR